MCGTINLKPNGMIAYNTWTSYYFTRWGHQDCAHWNNLWVTVLRKPSSGTPSAPVMGGAKDPSMAPTDDWTMGPTLREPAAPSQVLASSTAVADIDASFGRVVHDQGLASKAEIGELVDGGHVTHVSRVTSLVTNFPDYLLATVVGKHGARSVAMFTLAGGSPALAGLTTADTAMPKYPFVSSAEAEHAVRDSGATPTKSTPELVWGWSAESESPYYPCCRVETTGGYRYVDQFGQVTSELTLEAEAR